MNDINWLSIDYTDKWNRIYNLEKENENLKYQIYNLQNQIQFKNQQIQNLMKMLQEERERNS